MVRHRNACLCTIRSNERGVRDRRLIEKERHGCERFIEYRTEVRITFTSATGPGSECRPV
jgi:hypothetical protein